MDFDKLIKKFEESDSVAVFGHMNPDGDSIGAVLAMAWILENHFNVGEVKLLSRDRVPRFLEFLPGSDRVTPCAEEPPGAAVDLSLLVDCGDAKRVGRGMEKHINNASSIAVIDHHSTNSGFGDINCTDPHASSTCEIICRLADAAGVDKSPDLATYLYTGIMFDTGRFIHSNTTPEVFQHCARLVAAGADPAYIATSVYSNRSISHLRLLGYVLSSFETDADTAIAYIVTSREKFKSLGATEEDNEGVVEKLGSYADCEVHISFMELEGGVVRVSMRSKGRLNVGNICKHFGGGGHDFAAGIRIEDTLENVRDKVIAETKTRLAELPEPPEAVDD